MKFRVLALIIPLFALSGCTNGQLRHNTVTQASTLSEVQHQQVLNNLAAIAVNPDGIPFHVNLHDGTAQITDNGALTGQVINQRFLTLGVQRTAVDQWSMTPVTDDITIRLLQLAYRRAVLGWDENLYSNDNELANDLAHELKKQTTTVDDLRTTEATSEVRPKVPNQSRDEINHLFDAPLPDLDNLFDQNVGKNFKNLITAIVTYNDQSISDNYNEFIRAFPPLYPGYYSIQGVGFSLIEAVMNHDPEGLREAARELVLLSNATLKEKATIIYYINYLMSNRETIEYKKGYSFREIALTRTDYNKVLSSNQAQIIRPGEVLTDENLLYAALPKGAVQVISVTGAITAPPPPGPDWRPEWDTWTVRVQDPRTLQYRELKIRWHMRAADLQAQVDQVFGPHNVIVTGRMVAPGSPLILNFVGELAGRSIPIMQVLPSGPEVEPETPPGFPIANNAKMIISAESTYMKATPLVAELRRQVKEVEKEMESIHSGWLGVGGSKHDVPKDACYQAVWKDCGQVRYVWVVPQYRKEFEDFTVKILNFSGLIKNVNVSGAAGVKYSPGTSGGGAVPAFR